MVKTRAKKESKQEHGHFRDFQQRILSWYRKNGRHDLPWRPPALKVRKDGSVDPYTILVSEVMLQQTQVDRVIPKFTSFIQRFPTADTLARAKIRELFSEWKGLGYNRRALYLHRAARMIAHEWGGVFPRDPAMIEQLPGVGPYTARAVAAFSFDAPHVCIETNIRRIFLHHFFPGKQGVLDAEILPFVEKTLWKKSPRAWYSALMDYGSLAMKHIQNPNIRSRQYVRQSKFEGSRRYARAKILDFIAQSQKAVSVEALANALSGDPLLEEYRSPEKVLVVLRLLATDGFVKMDRSGSRVSLRG